MRYIYVLLLCCLAGIAAEPGSMILHLRDGSILKQVVLVETELPINATAGLGQFSVPIERLSVLAIAEGAAPTVTLHLLNGDHLQGELLIEALHGRHALGELTVPIADLRYMGRGLMLAGLHMVSGTADGQPTSFAKEMPEAFPDKPERMTLTLGASGPVVGRHDRASWLYPVRGRGEAPHPFTFNGYVLLPILGSWRQRWQDGWVYRDENGGTIRGAGSGSHWESKVDYFVLPAELLPANSDLPERIIQTGSFPPDGGVMGLAREMKTFPHWCDAGETLESIARMYDSKIEWILLANPGLTVETPLEGKKIHVPVLP